MLNGNIVIPPLSPLYPLTPLSWETGESRDKGIKGDLGAKGYRGDKGYREDRGVKGYDNNAQSACFVTLKLHVCLYANYSVCI